MEFIYKFNPSLINILDAKEELIGFLQVFYTYFPEFKTIS